VSTTKSLLLVAIVAFGFAAPVVATPPASPHASREAVLTFLRSEGILGEGTQLIRADWDEKAQWWFVSIRHPSGGITNWTVDAAAKDYRFVCKN
jgi:hypothetical protein